MLPLDRWERDNPNVSYPVFVPGEGDLAEFYVTNPHFAKTMSRQRFARVKPPGVKRVFILGGSAALGWPGPVESGFTGYIQRALDQVAPGRYEIINTAAMSYGSHRVVDLLSDIVRMEPDLIVVWSGNNEYIEQNTLSSFARMASLGKLQRVLRHSSLYRSVRLGLGVAAPALFVAPKGIDVTDLRSTPDVRRGMLGRSIETDRRVLESYRANLQSMAHLIRKSGSRGVFCTVPVNLSNWVPTNLNEWLSGMVPAELGDPHVARQWTSLSDSASQFGEQERYAEASVALEKLLEITPRYALGHYLLGVAYLQLGRIPNAMAAFSMARDLDPRPVRALSSFEQTIREVAAVEGFPLVDLERAFAEASKSGVPGLDLFLDYVHPNEAGHKVAAIEVLTQIAKEFGLSPPQAQLETIVWEDDWAKRQKNNQAAVSYTLGMTLYNNGDLDGAKQAYLRALEEDPNFSEPAGNLGAIYEVEGNLAASRQFYERAVRLDPGTSHAANLARVLYRLGDHQGAREIVERLLKQGGAVDVRLFIMLGDIALLGQRYEEAQEFYLRARDAGSEDPELTTKIEASRRKTGKTMAPLTDGSGRIP